MTEDKKRMMEDEGSAAEQMEKVENETKKEENGVYSIRLRKAIKIKGEDVDELEFRFDDITGKDIEAIDRELTAMNHMAVVPAYDNRFKRMVSARAAGIPADTLLQMNGSDYMLVANRARTFLLGLG